jgi:EAL and modified HD-GYP domain-containing signal transduction protein
MSIAAEPSASQAPGPGAPLFISRQPVLDDQRRVSGYRISYAGVERLTDAGAPRAVAEGSATRLFGDIVSVVGLEELVGEALAHLPISRELLLTLGVPPVRPDRVVLRVAHSIAVDPQVRPILESLCSRGYSLSLYDLPALELDPDLLGLFGIVELDPSAWDPRALIAAVAGVSAERALPLAVGLRTPEEYERAKLMGFGLFAGPFFAAPSHTEVRDVPVGALNTLSAAAHVQSGASIEELERIIDRDLGLSVKLLRYINSAYFGMRSQITSIRQAVMMLGARGVSRWALMVALTGASRAPAELSVMALTRARMCELLAAGRPDVAPDELFLIGLLSLADALLDTPLDKVLEELPLADSTTAALLHRSGPAGAVLDAVTNYEMGSFENEAVQAYGTELARAYVDALRWARDTIGGLG